MSPLPNKPCFPCVTDSSTGFPTFLISAYVTRNFCFLVFRSEIGLAHNPKVLRKPRLPERAFLFADCPFMACSARAVRVQSAFDIPERDALVLFHGMLAPSDHATDLFITDPVLAHLKKQFVFFLRPHHVSSRSFTYSGQEMTI